MPEQEAGERAQHFYGGQAVIEGVMMRGEDHYGVAVRRSDGQVVLLSEPLTGLAVKQGWHKWPLIRGCYMLVESLSLGMKALQFSADVLTQEETEKTQATTGKAPEPEAPPATMSRVLMGLTTLFALALGIGLFVLLPTAVPRWIWGPKVMGLGTESIILNLVEGGIRLAIIVLYILSISLMKYVRRVFEYHGAEHATINCYEAGEELTPDNCVRHSPLHPRCGSAFLLVVIVVKIIVGCFLGWPVLWLRMILRLALLPVVAGLAYEILRWSGRHRHSLLAIILAGPGLLLQMITTRRPDRSQAEIALYALHAASVGQIALPAGFAEPRWVDVKLRPLQQEVATIGSR